MPRPSKALQYHFTLCAYKSYVYEITNKHLSTTFKFSLTQTNSKCKAFGYIGSASIKLIGSFFLATFLDDTV